MENLYVQLKQILDQLVFALEGTGLDQQLKCTYNNVIPQGTQSLKAYLSSILDAFEKVGIEIEHLRESLSNIKC